MRYTVRQIFSEDIEHDSYLRDWLNVTALKMALKDGGRFNPKDFKFREYAATYRFMICYRDGLPVGAHLSRLTRSLFDAGVTLLVQDVLYAEPRTRAAALLLRDFVAFGQRNADHVITMIGHKTNIKASSLLRMGFKKLDTLYRMEVR